MIFQYCFISCFIQMKSIRIPPVFSSKKKRPCGFSWHLRQTAASAQRRAAQGHGGTGPNGGGGAPGRWI